jgi:biotin synthase
MLPLDKNDILYWLQENDAEKLQTLWQMADFVRKETVGDDVHLRGLLEISNYCSRQCGYCGINAENESVERYRMTKDEIIECALKATKFGYGTVVMQSGEDFGLTAEWIEDVVRSIKKETPLAVTLSLGERSNEELKLWRKAGADRYLLRFETSDIDLYYKIHPGKKNVDIATKKHPRLEILKQLRVLGYEIGSGVMIGIPGQSYDMLVNDIMTFAMFDLDMIGVGPYIAHPKTALYNESCDQENQVPNTELMTYKVVALTRLMCPEANIPSTTALATLNKEAGRELGLMRGANVVMPNITPPEYRAKYEIYPNKACITDTAEQCFGCMTNRIKSIGRTVGKGKGGRKGRCGCCADCGACSS